MPKLNEELKYWVTSICIEFREPQLPNIKNWTHKLWFLTQPVCVARGIGCTGDPNPNTSPKSAGHQLLQKTLPVIPVFPLFQYFLFQTVQ